MFSLIKVLIGFVIGLAVGYIFQPQIADFLNSDQGKELVQKTKDKVNETTQKAKDFAEKQLNK